MAEIPPALDQDEECVGCGNEKTLRGKVHSALICCNTCWRKLPPWMREAFKTDQARPADGPEHGPTIWQNRIALFLSWMASTRKAVT